MTDGAGTTAASLDAGGGVSWSQAWHEAHLGPRGFYRREVPGRHFATEAQSGPLAHLLAEWIRQIARRWGAPDDPDGRTHTVDVVDIGAGAGELLTALHGSLCVQGEEQQPRLRFTGIDVRPRPHRLPDDIDWITGEAPQILRTTWPEGITGIVLAHEWLDDLPIDVVARDQHGVVREVLVDPRSGRECLGAPVPSDSSTQRWLEEWWGPVRDRAEIGRHRDDAWREVCSAIRSGVALAIDYAHLRAERQAGRFDGGSLVGYARGESRWPVPDGSMNITAHVALDACAAATQPPGVIVEQSAIVDDLWASTDLASSNRVTGADAEADPMGFARALECASERRSLRERSAGYRWLRYDSDPDERGRATRLYRA